MEICTRDFGTIEIDESSIIRFADGIIGFEDYHDFVLLDDGDDMSPFRRLQSVEDSGLAFILLDPFSVKPDYEFTIDDDMAARLSIGSDEDVVVFSIVVIPDDIKLMSINLKAPIIINSEERRGAQYIIDRGDYGVRHYILSEIERAKSVDLCEGQTAV